MANGSAVFNVLRLLTKPSLCLPHATVSRFDQIPWPASQILATANGGRAPDIRALVLDKDDCFAISKQNVVYGPYDRHFEAMRRTYTTDGLLIVSNSAGSKSDPTGAEAKLLEKSTGIEVLRHPVKKPGCWEEVYRKLQSRPGLDLTHPSQIAVIGDRLMTDIMMANLIGCWGIWIQDGIQPDVSAFSHLEESISGRLSRMGFVPPSPRGPR